MNRNAVPEEPFGRFVLLALVELAEAGETPVHSFDVRDRCAERVDLVRGVRGGVGRTEVQRALDPLTDAGLVTSEETTSPVGKGRPAHGLAVDADEVLDALAADPDVSDYVGAIRG